MASWWPADEGAGGVQAHVHWLTRALRRRGHDVQVIHLADRGRRGERGRRHRLPEALRLPDTAQTYLDRARDARRLVRSAPGDWPAASAFDLTHFHDFTRIIPLSRRLARQGRPLVWTNHLGEFLKLVSVPGGSRLTRYATRHFDAAIAPSQELSQQSAIGVRSTYIPNGVEVARFPAAWGAEKRLLRQRLGVDPARPLVVVPRRWSPTKGVLEAALALDHLGDVEVTVAFLGAEGAQEYPGYGARIRRQLAHHPGVVVHDAVSYAAMSDWLRASSATLIPSVLEATSLSALEAMSAGSVVVAAPVGGLLQLVRHQDNGIVLEDRRPVSIAAALRDLLSRPDADADRLRARARGCVEAEYSWDAIAARTEQVYQRVLRARGRAPA